MNVSKQDENGSHKIWNKNFILIMLANFFVALSYISMTPVFPIYLENHGYTQDVAGVVTGIFVVTALSSRPYAGKILDAGHRKDTYLVGQLISIVSISMYAFVQSAVLLSLLRLLHGIGIGIVTTAANTIAVDYIPRQKMSEGIGYLGLSTVLSMAIAPSLGLYLIDHWGFKVMFLSAAGMCLVGSILALLVRYKKRTATLKIMKTIKGGKMNLIEKRAIKPAAIGSFAGIAFGVTSGFIAVYGLEKQVEHIGLFFTVFALVLVITRPAAGRLADRKGFGYAIVPGILLQMVSMVLLFFADDLLMFLIAASILGVGSGATQTTLNAMAVYNVAPQRRGAAISTFYIGLDLAAGLGPMLGGVVATYLGFSIMYLLTVIPLSVALLIFVLADRGLEKENVHLPIE